MDVLFGDGTLSMLFGFIENELKLGENNVFSDRIWYLLN